MSDEKTWEDEFFKNTKLTDVSSYQDDRIRDWIKMARYSGYMEACKKRNEEIQQLKQQLEAYKESDKVLSDMLESRENDILKLKKQLEEAVEVIAEFNEYREATDRKETSKSNTKWHTYERILYDKAKRFIAKYRGEK